MTTEQEQKSHWNRRAFKIAIIVILACFGIGVYYPQGEAINPIHALLLSNARQLALACKLYAGDHEGKLPEKLADVVPAYIDAARYQKLMFRIPKKMSAWEKILSLGGIKTGPDEPVREWNYYGSGLNWPADGILITSPQYNAWRVVVYSDTSGEIIRESEFEQLMSMRQREQAVTNQ